MAGDPLRFFVKTSQAILTGWDTETVTNVTSAEDCALLCLWDRPECQSFEYDPVNLDCMLSNTSATLQQVQLAMDNTTDYYELGM